jgi:hypothetical protein
MAELTLAEVKELIANLKRAIITGQLQVTYADKTVRYRDMQEMKDALTFARQEAADLGGPPVNGARQILMVTEDDW